MASINRERMEEGEGEGEEGPRMVYIPMNLAPDTTTTAAYAALDFLSNSSSSPSSSSSSSPPPSSSSVAACSGAQLCRRATPSEVSAASCRDVPLPKKSVSAKPLPMKRSGSGKALNAFAAAGQIKEETVVHTNAADFRRIVHELTGAAPTSSGRMATARGSKLHERRKPAMRHLSTSGLVVLPNEPPKIPAYSPVTPLASDFEKFCLPPNTPPSSRQSSAAPSPATAAINPHLNYKHATATSTTPKQQQEQEQRDPHPTLLQLFPPSPSTTPQPK